MSDKYVVLAVDDWERLKREVPSRSLEAEIEAAFLKDAEVIRLKDPLAGPGLHAYAGAADAMIEGAELARAGTPYGRSEAEVDLEQKRAWAFHAAEEADAMQAQRRIDRRHERNRRA